MTTLKDKQVLDLTKGNTPYDLMVSTVCVETAPEQEPLLCDCVAELQKNDIMMEFASMDSAQEWKESYTDVKVNQIPRDFISVSDLPDDFPLSIDYSNVTEHKTFITPAHDVKVTSIEIYRIEEALKAINARIEAYNSLFPHPETDAWLRALTWVKTLLSE